MDYLSLFRSSQSLFSSFCPQSYTSPVPWKVCDLIFNFMLNPALIKFAVKKISRIVRIIFQQTTIPDCFGSQRIPWLLYSFMNHLINFQDLMQFFLNLPMRLVPYSTHFELFCEWQWESINQRQVFTWSHIGEDDDDNHTSVHHSHIK